MAKAFADCNCDRICSPLGYVTPNEFARKTEGENKCGIKLFKKMQNCTNRGLDQ